MTLFEFASLYNALGVGTGLLISLLVSRKYPSAFFQYWSKAYAGAFVLLIMEMFALRYGRGFSISVAEIAVIVISTWFFLKTGLAVQGKTLARVWFWLALALSLVYAAVLMTAGFAYALVSAPLAICYAGAIAWCGLRFMRMHNPKGHTAPGRWLGWPILLTGLWDLSYPICISLSIGWFGYLVAGVLNQLVGIGMALFLMDEAASQLRVHNTSLVQLDEMKNSFIRTMSHELRTPLSSLAMATHLLSQGRAGPLNERQTEFMGIIEDTSGQLNRLVVDLLDFSRMESGVMGYELERGDLGAAIAAATRGLGHQMAAQGIELLVELPASPVLARFDRGRLTQVIGNLLINAKNFTPRGGQVIVRLRSASGASLIEVEDTGIGMAADELPKIFDQYYQGQGTSTHKAGGLGLGLAIARSIIVDGHGGTLEVASTPGVGSLFTITLPTRLEEGQVASNTEVKVGVVSCSNEEESNA